MGVILLLNYEKNSHTFAKFVIELVAIWQEKFVN